MKAKRRSGGVLDRLEAPNKNTRDPLNPRGHSGGYAEPPP